jgi:predicted nucleotidyltransferase
MCANINDQHLDAHLDSPLIEKIAALCSREKRITAAYLFGSAAVGKRRPSSDIDIAILVERDCVDEFPLVTFISSVEKLCGCPVDVVLLNRAGELLKYEVRRSGRLIFERNARKRKQFEVLGRKSYEDFLYLHRRYVDSVLYGKSRG